MQKAQVSSSKEQLPCIAKEVVTERFGCLFRAIPIAIGNMRPRYPYLSDPTVVTGSEGLRIDDCNVFLGKSFPRTNELHCLSRTIKDDFSLAQALTINSQDSSSLLFHPTCCQ